MHNDEFKKLLVERYVQNTATDEELEVFFLLLKNHELDEYLTDEMVLEESKSMGKNSPPVWKLPVWLVAAAASVIIIIIAAVFYLRQPNGIENEVTKNETPLLSNDVPPGGNRATLTLADGSTVILDDAGNGKLAEQEGAEVIKTDEGRIVYEGKKTATGTLEYNTVSTPRGGQYQLTLADGTRVWLNAESSLRYPTAFTGDNRKVELAGEGYFEVAADAAKPFIVTVDEMNVKVLGTHFNIDAYGDDGSIKTTLLKGSVEVGNNAQSARIRPGEQAQYNTTNHIIKTTDNIDPDQAVAWKEGYFSFQETDLKTLMLQISRWYDVEVVYEGKPSDERFSGEVSRNSNVSEILKILLLSSVHTRVEGNKIIIEK